MVWLLSKVVDRLNMLSEILYLREILYLMWKYWTLEAVLLAFFMEARLEVIHIFNTFQPWPEILSELSGQCGFCYEGEDDASMYFCQFQGHSDPFSWFICDPQNSTLASQYWVLCHVIHVHTQHTTQVSDLWVIFYFFQASENLWISPNSKLTSPTPSNFIKRKLNYKLRIHYSITALHKAQQKKKVV